MKRWIKQFSVVIWTLFLMFQFGPVSAYDGTCGADNKVAYTIEDSAISFTSAFSGESAIFTDSCTDVIRNTPGITEVNINSDPVAAPDNTRRLFSELPEIEMMDHLRFCSRWRKTTSSLLPAAMAY